MSERERTTCGTPHPEEEVGYIITAARPRHQTSSTSTKHTIDDPEVGEIHSDYCTIPAPQSHGYLRMVFVSGCYRAGSGCHETILDDLSTSTKIVSTDSLCRIVSSQLTLYKMASSTKAVQTFGKKKVRRAGTFLHTCLFKLSVTFQTATAVAYAREGKGLLRINGSPINLVQPEILRFKVYEPVLVAGEDTFANIDIRVRVKGGGHTSQIYAIRQAISKAVVAYYAKYVDAFSAIELKKKLVAYDRTLLIADPRRMEPKKFGGAGARARRQKR